MNKPLITPKTKVAELLENYPELEVTLIKLSPSFEKLKNPVLRKTIARVATLQQVAIVGNLSLETLINTLRGSVNQETYETIHETMNTKTQAPAWLKPENVAGSLDAREMLERGEHPMVQVLEKSHALPSGAIFELITSFIPQPLIEKVVALRLDYHTIQESDSIFRTYFHKP